MPGNWLVGTADFGRLMNRVTEKKILEFIAYLCDKLATEA